MRKGVVPSMRTGKEIILATKAYAVDSSVRSWAHILSTAALLAAALAGTIWNFHLAGRMACSFVAGLLYLRFFVIYHDQQHQAILPHSRLAEFLMRIFGIFILSPSSVWKSSHNHHHNHNSKLRGSHIGSFPIMTKEQYFKSSRSARFRYLFMRHPLTMLFGYLFVFHYGMCLHPSFTRPREHYDGLVAFFAHLVLALAIIWLFGWLALFLTLPFLTLSPPPSGAICFTPNTTSLPFPLATIAVGPTIAPLWNPRAFSLPAQSWLGSPPILATTTSIT